MALVPGGVGGQGYATRCGLFGSASRDQSFRAGQPATVKSEAIEAHVLQVKPTFSKYGDAAGSKVP